jgi:hypothetical protein
VRLSRPAQGPAIADAQADFLGMIEPERPATSDPLGIGGLLADACTLARVDPDDALLPWTLDAAARGLREYVREPHLRAPAPRRLAFRELGLAIGLAAVPAALSPWSDLREDIEAFWLRPEHRESPAWRDHLDINEVMLATSLAPQGFLVAECDARR